MKAEYALEEPDRQREWDAFTASHPDEAQKALAIQRRFRESLACEQGINLLVAADEDDSNKASAFHHELLNIRDAQCGNPPTMPRG